MKDALEISEAAIVHPEDLRHKWFSILGRFQQVSPIRLEFFVITLEQSCKLVQENRANYLKTILRFSIVPESDVLWKLE